MKTSFSLWIALLAMGITFTGCKKDDDKGGSSTPSNEERISGVWYLTDMDASGTVDFMGTTLPFVTTGATISPGSYFDFRTSPSQSVNYSVDADIDISAGTNITVPYQRSGTGTWEFKGNDSLIITESGSTTRYGILSWNDTRMILRSNQQISFGGQSANAQIEATIER
ncbi:MAG: hypothetical protein EP346_12600 [Bacteroidetes bacterium]|nr:MAG: hypothetical protein EP346_12600 [Bacteroidota bacterium]